MPFEFLAQKSNNRNTCRSGTQKQTHFFDHIRASLHRSRNRYRIKIN